MMAGRTMILRAVLFAGVDLHLLVKQGPMDIKEALKGRGKRSWGWTANLTAVFRDMQALPIFFEAD